MTDLYEDDLTADDLEVGDSPPDLVIEDVDRKDFVKYAGASGDFNRIHYDDPYAKEAGNESVFGQGMLTAAYGAHFVANWLGIEHITKYKVRFLDRLWPGKTLEVSGEVTDVVEQEEGVTVTASVSVLTQEGTELVTGEIVADFPTE